MKVGGTVHVPGDKSISHRALIVAALATGVSRIRGILQSADVESTATVLRSLGVEVPHLSGDIRIRGVGLQGLTAPHAPLQCGNSGTTVRLMSGVVAGSPIRAQFIGDASLSRRPMRRVARPLEAMGARVTIDGSADGLPMTVEGGALRPLAWTTETASAQTKSAILLAGLVAGVTVTVMEPGRSRDHTERLLSALGVRIERASGGVPDDDAATGDPMAATERVTLFPVASLPPLDIRVPGDPSSAAFFAAVAALSPGGQIVLPDVLTNETRAGFMQALRSMGASVDEAPATAMGAGERVGTLRVRGGSLRGIALGAAQVPAMIDELPLLACVAARAQGETVITGAAELRVKESDRITAVVENLRALGVEADELPDGIRIVGTPSPLRGAVRTHADHRIAMAFGVLSMLEGSDIEIDDPHCVSVSYPNFWEDLRRVVT